MTTTINLSEKLNKFERYKVEKDGLAVKEELDHFAQIGWEAMDETDLTQRLKWLGIFFRPVTPGKFMLRLRMPHGCITSGQMRTLGEIVQRYGDDGNADITTRQNLQLRGVRLEDIPDIFQRLECSGLTSIQSGMDNVRNITGSPVAGLDADELIDTRGLVRKVQDMITNNSKGNLSFTNLPRKFNIAIAGCRDNSVHAEINDIAFVPAYKNKKLGFNVLVGGFFSAKRCAPAIPLDVWIEPLDVVAISEAILVIFRDHGPRGKRHQSRLMWLIEDWGMEKFRAAVENHIGCDLETAAPKDEILWDKRDHIGVHAQKQPGLNFVGLHIPVGRLYAAEMFDLARLADVYGSGEIRLTVEQNAIIPNIPDSRLGAFLREPLLEAFSASPKPLARALVSCTGSQFCKFALIETKNQATALIDELDQALNVPQPVRIHWTGCPNSCGQPQVADIGLMGTKARKDGKTVDAVNIYMGGTVGKDAKLGECVQQSVPCEDLKDVLTGILTEKFGAQPSTSNGSLPTARLTRQRSAGLTIVAKLPAASPALPSHRSDNISAPVPSAPAAPPQPAVVCIAGQAIEGDNSQTLLEFAEGAGVAIESSCQSGSCGTCKKKLLEGDISYAGDPDGLEDHEQAAGYILTCIAHPVGRVVLTD
ncbi:MAG: ferredoxin--nitrite reductase [Thermosynechococcaceae cyanobacterium]